MDILESIFEIQRKFQEKYNFDIDVHDWCSAMAAECMELWAASGGKWWKKKTKSRKKQVVELIDILHFFVGLCLELDVTPHELFTEYISKMNINIARQESGEY